MAILQLRAMVLEAKASTPRTVLQSKVIIDICIGQNSAIDAASYP